MRQEGLADGGKPSPCFPYQIPIEPPNSSLCPMLSSTCSLHSRIPSQRSSFTTTGREIEGGGQRSHSSQHRYVRCRWAGCTVRTAWEDSVCWDIFNSVWTGELETRRRHICCRRRASRLPRPAGAWLVSAHVASASNAFVFSLLVLKLHGHSAQG